VTLTEIEGDANKSSWARWEGKGELWGFHDRLTVGTKTTREVVKQDYMPSERRRGTIGTVESGGISDRNGNSISVRLLLSYMTVM